MMTETRYESDHRIAPHTHADAAFCLVLAGSYEERFGSMRLSVAPSRLLFRPAGEVHEDLMEDGIVRCFIVEASADWIEGSVGTRLTVPAVMSDLGIVSIAVRLRREAKQPDDLTSLAVDALMNELIVACARRHERRSDSRLATRVASLLDDHFRESISLRDVAEALQVQPAHLASHFRRARGCSVGEYVRSRRVECAAAMIRSNEISLAEVALAAGFAHHSHLCRIFKRIVGVTPAAYRRQFRR